MCCPQLVNQRHDALDFRRHNYLENKQLNVYLRLPTALRNSNVSLCAWKFVNFRKCFKCGKKFFLQFWPKSFPASATFDIFTAVTIKFRFLGYGNLWPGKKFADVSPKLCKFLPYYTVSHSWVHTKNCNRWPKHTYGKLLPVLLWSVEETLEPMCNFPRVTLRRT